MVALVILVVVARLIPAALPVLLVAACPLSMVLMMRTMTRDKGAAPTPAEDQGQDAQIADLRSELTRIRAELQGRDEARN